MVGDFLINVNSKKYKFSLFFYKTVLLRFAIKKMLWLTVAAIYLIYLWFFPYNIGLTTSLGFCCIAFFAGRSSFDRPLSLWFLIIDMFFHEFLSGLNPNFLISLISISFVILLFQIVREVRDKATFYLERIIAKFVPMLTAIYVWISGPEKVVVSIVFISAILISCFLCSATNWLQLLDNQDVINRAVKTAEMLSSDEIDDLILAKEQEAKIDPTQEINKKILNQKLEANLHLVALTSVLSARKKVTKKQLPDK